MKIEKNGVFFALGHKHTCTNSLDSIPKNMIYFVQHSYARLNTLNSNKWETCKT